MYIYIIYIETYIYTCISMDTYIHIDIDTHTETYNASNIFCSLVL